MNDDDHDDDDDLRSDVKGAILRRSAHEVGKVLGVSGAAATDIAEGRGTPEQRASARRNLPALREHMGDAPDSSE